LGLTLQPFVSDAAKSKVEPEGDLDRFHNIGQNVRIAGIRCRRKMKISEKWDWSFIS
jgi:hypothetical protein